MRLNCTCEWEILAHGSFYLCTEVMANLHNDVMYEGWGKTSAAGHRECMGNSKRVLKRSISLQHGRTDCLHVLRIAAQRGGVFMSEANGHIGVWCEALIA